MIDVTIELLRKSLDSWVPADPEVISLGDHVALRCRNLGDHEVSAAVFLRTMPGELKTATREPRDLWPNIAVEFGTMPDQPIVVGEEDIEIVLAVSPYEHLIHELLESPLREQNLVASEMALLSTPLEGRPVERKLSDDDLEDLLELAFSDEFTIAAYALQALTLLQPPPLTRNRITRLIRERLRLRQLISRPWLISIAANLGDVPLRRHLRGIAADSNDPHRNAAVAALGEVGDADGLDALIASLQRSAKERTYAARLIATRYPGFDVTSILGDAGHGSFAFWMAMAAARQGSFAGIEQHVTGQDDIGFQRTVGDDINMFYAFREIRPLPPEIQEYIERELRHRELADSVKAFYETLLSQADAPALHDGSRTIPAHCVDKIRNHLVEIPGITQLASYATEGDGWERALNLSRAYRGVLLVELLRQAVTERNPLEASVVVQRLITGWNQRPWYPYLEGLLSVVQELESIGSDSVLAGIELQVGWLLSRAPIPSLVRLVSRRVKTGVSSVAEVRSLVNAIVTHWDGMPPPSMADVTRVPQMIQPIPLAEDRPGYETRAWLEHKSYSDGVWSMRILLTIALQGEELVDQEANAIRAEGSPSNKDSFDELIVVLRANEGIAAPNSAEIQLSNERKTGSATFEITTEKDSLQLRVSVYQRQPTTILQELKGIIELTEGERGK